MAAARIEQDLSLRFDSFLGVGNVRITILRAPDWDAVEIHVSCEANVIPDTPLGGIPSASWAPSEAPAGPSLSRAVALPAWLEMDDREKARTVRSVVADLMLHEVDESLFVRNPDGTMYRPTNPHPEAGTDPWAEPRHFRHADSRQTKHSPGDSRRGRERADLWSDYEAFLADLRSDAANRGSGEPPRPSGSAGAFGGEPDGERPGSR